MDDQEYLQPGFDPTSYTMPKLRNVLMSHDVDYPSNAKKAQLVELFETHIAPLAPAILKKTGKVKASSKGIVDVADFGTIGEPITEATPRKRNSRRKTQSALTDEDERTTADPEDTVETTAKKTKKAGAGRRRTQSPVKRIIDDMPAPATIPEPIFEAETPRGKPGRKSTRKSMSVASARTPEVEPEPEPEEELSPIQIIKNEESAFSSENPFQQSSSPAPYDRRKSMPAKDTGHSRKASGGSRRKTDFIPATQAPRRSLSPFVDNTARAPIVDETQQPEETSNYLHGSRFYPSAKLSMTLQKQAHQAREDVKREQEEFTRLTRDPSVQPGEEFTPDEQLEVELADQEAHAHGSAARDRVAESESSGRAASSALWVLLSVAIVSYFAWWRKEKLEIGYCGVGRRVDFGDDRPDWTTILRPKCEYCPLHATCFPNLETVCDQDYVLVTNPMSLGGLVPLAPSCRPDSEKLRRIAVLTNEALKILRVRAAEVECGEIDVAEGEEGLSENDLRSALYQRKAPGLSDAAFNDLWRHAFTDLEKKEEIEGTIASSGEKIVRSTSLANISLYCTIKKSTTGALSRYKIELFGILGLVFMLLRLRKGIAKSREYQVQVSGLVQKALRALAQQQRAHYQDPTKTQVPYVPVGQLRDRVLRHEYNPETRRHLWEGVSKIVESNSNVRATQMEVMGEVMRCWTWIGSAAMLDDSQPEVDEMDFIQGGTNGKGFATGRRSLGGDPMTPRVLY